MFLLQKVDKGQESLESPLRLYSGRFSGWVWYHVKKRGNEMRQFIGSSREWHDHVGPTLDLEGCRVKFDDKRALCFQIILAEGKEWLFEARTERERRRWVLAIDPTVPQPLDMDVEELDSPAIDVQVSEAERLALSHHLRSSDPLLQICAPSFEDDPSVYEKCEALMQRMMRLLKTAHIDIAGGGTTDTVVGMLSLGDQQRNEAHMAAFDLDNWDHDKQPLDSDDALLRWRFEGDEGEERRVDLRRGSGFHSVHVKEQRPQSQEIIQEIRERHVWVYHCHCLSPHIPHLTTGSIEWRTRWAK